VKTILFFSAYQRAGLRARHGCAGTPGCCVGGWAAPLAGIQVAENSSSFALTLWRMSWRLASKWPSCYALRMKVCVAGLAILFSLPVSAGTLVVIGDTFTIEASVTVSQTGPQSLFDSESYSQSYLLDVTGATTIPVDPDSGSDFAELDFTLQGTINTPPVAEPGISLQGDADVSSPFDIFVPVDDSPPQLFCTPYLCSIPLVFNEPETVVITASVQTYFASEYAVTPVGYDAGQIIGSVTFNGLGEFTDGAGAVLGGVQYSFVPTPEPATILSLGAALLLLAIASLSSWRPALRSQTGGRQQAGSCENTALTVATELAQEFKAEAPCDTAGPRVRNRSESTGKPRKIILP
jgi:hypothetical protein